MFESVEGQFDFLNEALRTYQRLFPQSPAKLVKGFDDELRSNISGLSQILGSFKDLTVDSESRESPISLIPTYCITVLKICEEVRQNTKQPFLTEFIDSLETDFILRARKHYGSTDEFSSVDIEIAEELEIEQSVNAVDSIDNWMLAESVAPDSYARVASDEGIDLQGSYHGELDRFILFETNESCYR